MNPAFYALQLPEIGDTTPLVSLHNRKYSFFDFLPLFRIGNIIYIVQKRFRKFDFHFLKTAKTSSRLTRLVLSPSSICDIKYSSPNRLFSARLNAFFSGVTSRLGVYDDALGVTAAVSIPVNFKCETAKISDFFFAIANFK